MAGRDWTVLLIGGGSGTGKSTLAGELSRRLGVPWMHADDVRMAAQRMISAESEPLLHFFDEDVNWERSVEELTEIHEQVSLLTCKGLEIIVSHHIAMSEPVILEGDDILPAFARAMIGEHGGRVAAAVLQESDDRALRENMLSRDRGLGERSAVLRERMMALAIADGQRLVSAARRMEVPVMESRPFESLSERAIAVFGTKRS